MYGDYRTFEISMKFNQTVTSILQNTIISEIGTFHPLIGHIASEKILEQNNAITNENGLNKQKIQI